MPDFVLLHEPAVANDVGGQYRREAAVSTFFGHGMQSFSRGHGRENCIGDLIWHKANNPTLRDVGYSDCTKRQLNAVAIGDQIIDDLEPPVFFERDDCC